DLRARRLRVLHPLSLVEDPTRILRAARFAARLRCRIDHTTRRLARHAARLDIYRALSGDRLRTELEILLADERPVAALHQAARRGAFGLLGATAPLGPTAFRQLSSALASRAVATLGPDVPLALTLLALTQSRPVTEEWMDRLALAPWRREAIRHAR